MKGWRLLLICLYTVPAFCQQAVVANHRLNAGYGGSPTMLTRTAMMQGDLLLGCQVRFEILAIGMGKKVAPLVLTLTE